MRIKILVAAMLGLAYAAAASAQDVIDVADLEYRLEDFNYRMAGDFTNSRNYDEAVSCLEKSLAENPDNARALMSLGAIYARVFNDFATAKKYLRKAADKAGKDYMLKVAALTRFSEVCLNNNEHDLAREYAQEAVELCDKMSPKINTGLNFLAFVYEEGEQPDYQAAASCHRKAIEIDPFDGYAWEHLLNCLVEIGTPESLKEAEQGFKRVPEIGLGGSDFLVHVGERCAFKQGDYVHCAKAAVAALTHYEWVYGEALKHVDMLDSASVHNPTAVRLILEAQMNAEPLLTKWPEVLGGICSRHKDYDNAIAAFRRAYDIDSASIRFLDNIAIAQYQKGDYEGAVRTCDALIARDTTYAYTYLLRAASNERLDRKAAVLADYDKAIAIKPTNGSYYYSRAWFERYNGMLDQAALDMTTAIQFDSRNSSYYLTRANILGALGDKEMAKEDYQAVIDLANRLIDDYSEEKPDGSKVIKNDSKDAASGEYSNRAYARFFLGDSDAATRDMLKSIDLKSDKGVAYYDGACFYSLMGQTDKALDYLRKAVESGYDNVVHMTRDTDLDNIRDTDGFKACVANAKARQEAMSNTTTHLATKSSDGANADQPDVVEIPFTKEGGVLYVTCTVNGLPLRYCFDSGASSVSISLSEAQFMLANGYLDAKDLGAIEYYGDATGGISAGMKVNLKSLTFGGLTIHNVKASVAGTLNAPLLLGQTAIQRLGNVHIDYDKGVIRITKRAAEK